VIFWKMFETLLIYFYVLVSHLYNLLVDQTYNQHVHIGLKDILLVLPKLV